MVGNAQLELMVVAARYAGATVDVTLDPAAEREGREIIDAVAVRGLRGIGPHPMPPIAAHERLRACSPLHLDEARGGVRARLYRFDVRLGAAPDLAGEAVGPTAEAAVEAVLRAAEDGEEPRDRAAALVFRSRMVRP